MNRSRQHTLNYRALIVLLMGCSFVWLPVAGLALHFADNAPFQPIRHLLMTIHNLAALIFFVSAVLHLKLNWKPMLNYCRVTTARLAGFRREMGIAVGIVGITLILGVLHVIVLAGR